MSPAPHTTNGRRTSHGAPLVCFVHQPLAHGDEPPPGDNGISSGVSYEELSDAADVLVTDTRDEARRTKAAKTLYDIQGTEILDFIVREVCGADAIDGLLKECLDGDGFPLKRKNPAVAEFDIGKYV